MKDGGPAFPSQHVDSEGRPQQADDGISKRDYFAAKAMSGLLSDPNTDLSESLLAVLSYRIADAMLAERERQS